MTPRRALILAPLLLAGCPAEEASPDAGLDGGGPACTCVALGSDYAGGVGVLSTVGLPGGAVTVGRVAGVASADPVVRVDEARVIVVNRYGADNVTILDRESFSLVTQISTGAGSNPQDAVVVDGSRLWVASLNDPAVRAWDLAGGGAPVASVDLSALDVDGNPDATSLALAGGRLFVALGRLDGDYVPRGAGQIAVIDPAAATLETTLTLGTANPWGLIAARGGELLVATVGDMSGTQGCLERIGVTPPAALGCLAGSEALGGMIGGFALGAEAAYAGVTGFGGDGTPWGRLTAVPGGALTTSPQVVSDVALCAASGQLLYNDRSIGALRVWDLAGGAAVGEPLDVGLPPVLTGGLACY